MAETIPLQKRIRGCLLLGAAGDALGYPIEFMNLNSIRAEYGSRGLHTMLTKGGFARFSDDTQMTLFTAEGLTLGYNRSAAGGIASADENYVYESYLNWMSTQGYPIKGEWNRWSALLAEKNMHARRAPGGTCLNSLAGGHMGTLDSPLNNSKGCGGVMRVAPIGFVLPFTNRYDDNIEDSYVWRGAKIGAITHSHPLSHMACGMMADMIHRVTVQPEKTLEEITLASLETTLRLLGDDWAADAADFRSIMERAVRLSREDLPDPETIEEELGGGWVAEEALAIAVYCALKYENDLSAALFAAVNHSGDSDSTGSITGHILGARFGEDALPAALIAPLELQDLIRSTADDFCAVCEELA